MRARAAAGLAVLCCLLGFGLGRLSVFGSGAVVRGGRPPVAMPALAAADAPQGEKALEFGLVDINAADAEALCRLPGIGEKTAGKIIAYREENGPFASEEELMAVRGIGPGTYENIKQYICAGR